MVLMKLLGLVVDNTVFAHIWMNKMIIPNIFSKIFLIVTVGTQKTEKPLKWGEVRDDQNLTKSHIA